MKMKVSWLWWGTPIISALRRTLSQKQQNKQKTKQSRIGSRLYKQEETKPPTEAKHKQ